MAKFCSPFKTFPMASFPQPFPFQKPPRSNLKVPQRSKRHLRAKKKKKRKENQSDPALPVLRRGPLWHIPADRPLPFLRSSCFPPSISSVRLLRAAAPSIIHAPFVWTALMSRLTEGRRKGSSLALLAGIWPPPPTSNDLPNTCRAWLSLFFLFFLPPPPPIVDV